MGISLLNEDEIRCWVPFLPCRPSRSTQSGSSRRTWSSRVVPNLPRAMLIRKELRILANSPGLYQGPSCPGCPPRSPQWACSHKRSSRLSLCQTCLSRNQNGFWKGQPASVWLGRRRRRMLVARTMPVVSDIPLCPWFKDSLLARAMRDGHTLQRTER